MTQRPRHRTSRFLLELDPDLGARLAPGEWERARQAVRGRPVALQGGACDLRALTEDGAPLLGFLVIDGMICHEAMLADRRLIEFIGPGDILQPAERNAPPGVRGVGEPSLTVINDAVVVALGSAFIRAATRWPPLLLEAVARLERRRARLAAQALIVHLPQARDRLLLILRHLGERWGRVTPDGLHLPLRLTHDLLGQLIAARRPTVTLAIRELEAEHHVGRREDGSWVLTERGQEAIARIAADGAGPGLNPHLASAHRFVV